MLIKKKLLEMPLPETPTRQQKGRKYGACVVENDIYQLAIWEKNTLIARTFSDGTNLISYDTIKSTWKEEAPQISELNETKECEERTKEFFKNVWGSSSTDKMENWLYNKRREKRWEQGEKRYKRMIQNIHSIPENPKDLGEYCERYVFEKKFILVSKGEPKRQKEKCKCLYCGKAFSYSGKLKQKQQLACPKCKAEGQAVLERYAHTAKEKASVLVFAKKENEDITAKWQKIERCYTTKGEPRYNVDPYRWEIHEKNGKIHRYAWKTTAYYGADYRAEKYENREYCHVYAKNLNEIFDTKAYKVDWTKLNVAGKVNFIRLRIQVAISDRARTLYQIGLPKLAEVQERLGDGDTFKEVLGVGKEYLPYLRKWKIGEMELSLMRLSTKHIPEDQIQKLSELCQSVGWDMKSRFEKMLSYMSFGRAVNYLYKQHLLRPKTQVSELVNLYNEYRRLSEELNEQLSEKNRIDTGTSSFIMPRDIKVAHDGVVGRLKTVNNKSKDRIIRKLGTRLQKEKPFESNNLILVYPKSIEDFVREGAELKHCIGSGMGYIDGQASGKKLSVFIRHKDHPDKPYYTATFYPGKKYELSECHGFSHKTPPEQIWKFLKDYQEYRLGSKKKEEAA